MLRHVSSHEYDSHTEKVLKAYEDAGLSAKECMNDITSYKTQWASDDGYADGVITGGIALIISGLICKWFAKKELKDVNNMIRSKLSYAASIKPLTDFNVPSGSDDDREENND